MSAPPTNDELLSHLGPTLCVEARDNLVIFVAESTPPRDDDWAAYMELLRRLASKQTTAKLRALVLPGSAKPNALQRKQIEEFTKKHPCRSAVVSDSSLARGVVTALRWFGVDMSAFPSNAIGEAIKFLDLTPSEDAWARETIPYLKRELTKRASAARSA